MGKITFINAGAGSGKTHALTTKLFNFIKNSSDKEIARKVMLTTFTKKAATEIRERVQEVLLNENLFDSAVLVKKAKMSTVHAVCYEFIKKYWYILGIPPSFQEISESEKEVTISHVLADAIEDEDLSKINYFMTLFKFKTYDEDSGYSNVDNQKWQTHVLELISQALSNKLDLSDPFHLGDSIARISTFFPGNIAFNEDTISKYRQNAINALANSTCTTESYLKASEVALDILSNPKEGLEYFLSAVTAINAIINLKLKNAPFLETVEALPEINLFELDLMKKNLIEYTEFIFQLANRVIDRYEDFKKTKGIVDFNDMENYFIYLLENKEVQDDIRDNLKLVMVDEFQDSNPIQLAIFTKLAELVETNYWVGDPKQSIYGFRGSDPILIDHIVRYFTDAEDDRYTIETLKMSWRSTPELVQFTNSIFSRSLTDQLYPFTIQSPEGILGKKDDLNFQNWKENIPGYPYQLPINETITMFPARSIDDLTQKTRKTIFWDFVQQGKNGGFKGAELKARDTEIAERILEILEDPDFLIFDKTKGISRSPVASDICILTFSNKHVSDITAKLRETGLEVNAETSSLESTAEYRLLYQIITIFVDPINALAKAEIHFLTGQEISIEAIIEERLRLILDETKSPEDWKNWLNQSDVIDRVLTIRKQSKHLSVHSTIEKIVSQMNIFGYLKGFNRDTVRQENISKLINLAQEYEAYCERNGVACGYHGYFNYIQHLPAKERKQTSSSSKNAVNVMTYHGCKGLEWPITILTSLEKDFKARLYENSFTTSVSTHGGFDLSNPLGNRRVLFSVWPDCISMSEEFKNKLEEDSLFNAFQINKINESKRLLYVGLTRARDYLILTNIKNDKNLPFLENAVGGNWSLPQALTQHNITVQGIHSNLDFFDIDLPIFYERALIPELRNRELKSEQTTKQYFQKHTPLLQNKNYKVNPSKVQKEGNATVSKVEEIHERLTFSSSELSGTDELGNALHYALYLRNNINFDSLISKMPALNKLKIDIENFSKNCKSFSSFIHDKYNPIEEYHELYLTGVFGDEFFEGEADLVLEESDGIVLIDYKSFPGKASEIFEKSSQFYAGKYFGQLDSYKNMIEIRFNKKVKALLIYYVVQGVVVEIK